MIVMVEKKKFGDEFLRLLEVVGLLKKSEKETR